MVSVDQAREWSDNILWIDARPDDEFARDHVPGAISLNEDRWNELFPQFSAVWSPEKKVVVYCSAQSCDLAREVAERLRKTTQPPMENVFVLEGGWEAWVRRTDRKCAFRSATSFGGSLILSSPQSSSTPECLKSSIRCSLLTISIIIKFYRGPSEWTGVLFALVGDFLRSCTHLSLVLSGGIVDFDCAGCGLPRRHDRRQNARS